MRVHIECVLCKLMSNSRVSSTSPCRLCVQCMPITICIQCQIINQTICTLCFVYHFDKLPVETARLQLCICSRCDMKHRRA